jgi:hypothetical protein
VPAGAQPGSGEIVAFHAGAGGVTWQPLIPFDHGVLVVSGPEGVVFHQAFGPGPALAFDPLAQPGGGLPDGVYVWEVRLGRPSAVSPHLRARAQAARGPGGDAAAEAALGLALRRATQVQSGAFHIEAGMLVPSDIVAPHTRASRARSQRRPRTPFAPAALAVDADDLPIIPADVVFTDDLIVDARACIGVYCADGVFLNDLALKLQDEQPWITFESPDRVWRLKVNEYPDRNDKVSIEDLTQGKIPFTIFGNATTNSLVVDPNGNVGLNTATPGAALHLRDGGFPTIRIEQDTAAGLAPYRWDVSGDLDSLAFLVRDATANLKAFSVQAGTGRVGIRTATPQGDLHINGSATQDLFSGMGPDLAAGPAFNFGYAGSSFGRGAGFFNVRPDASAVAPNPSLRFATANVQRLIITNTGNVGIGTLAPTNPLQMGSGARVTTGGVWTNASSREVKQDIAPLSADTARAALEQLTPVTFAYRADPAEHHVGFVAEDVPALVATADRKGLSPMDIVAVLTRVVQEQQRVAQAQQAAMARLEAEVAELRRAVRR